MDINRTKTLIPKLDDLVAKEHRASALEILIRCDKKWYDSFRKEYNKKSWNTACCAIDFAADHLVKEGKMTREQCGSWGNLGIT